MDLETVVTKEFNEIDSRNGWPLKFQEVRHKCSKYDYSVVEAKKQTNANLNRYRDVSPYDHTRVVLKTGNFDYINANIIKVDKANRKYILTQGPLPNTTNHFWLMVWEQNCPAVIMLNRVIEKQQTKCHQYWPIGSNKGGNDVMIFKEAGLKVEYISEIEESYFTQRKLKLTELETNTSREVLHFHYTTWPDFGVPQSPTAFLYFLAEVRRSGVLSPNVGPPIVHCSAGIGRSGTFCLVDSVLVMVKEKKEFESVFEVLLELRRHRMGLIQTPEQLRFSYLAIIEGLKDDWDNQNNIKIPVDDKNENHIKPSEEEPPPLPPPRQESLLPPLPPLPDLPGNENNLPSSSSETSPISSRSTSPDNEISEEASLIEYSNEEGVVQRSERSLTDEGVRQRTAIPIPVEEEKSEEVKSPIEELAEKQKAMAEKVAEMKRKQQDAEYWKRIKRRRTTKLDVQNKKSRK